jgi:hypothetical protein
MAFRRIDRGWIRDGVNGGDEQEQANQQHGVFVFQSILDQN